MSRRVFHSLLDHAGSEGTYQNILLGMGCLLGMQASATAFVGAYLFYQDPYHCPNTITNCQEYVCSLPAEEQYPYFDPGFSSMVSRFGNYRCRGHDLEQAQLIMYSGGVVLPILGLFIMKWLTQRKIIVLTTLVTCLGLILTLISPSLTFAAWALFLHYGVKCIQYEVLLSYLPDMVSENLRVKTFMACQIFSALGIPLLSVVYRFIRPWQLAMVVYQLVPYLVIIFLMLRYAKQTPLEQVTQHSVQSSVQMFQQIAHINKVECSINEDQIVEVKQQYQQSQRNKSHKDASVLDFCRYQSLRIPTLVSILLHFLVSYQFNASELVLKDYALDIYLNGAIIGLSSVVACVVGIFVLQSYPRKLSIMVLQLTSFFIAGALFVWLPCVGEASCSSTEKALQTVGLFLYRLIITVAYFFFNLGQLEFFPSQIRSLGMVMTNVASKFAVFVIPYVQSRFEDMNLSIILTFAISSFLMVVTALGFPQTYGIKPPQMIKQLEYEANWQSSIPLNNQAQLVE